MARHQPGSDRIGQPPRIDATRGTLVLDRRRFLQLAAAGGVAAAGAAAGWRLALGQDDAGAEGTSPDVPDVVTAMAAELGHDPERIFRFVADEVRYEPYAGVLRGANGTLVARAGNSADQSLLLAGLLKASDIPVRFASGSLDDEVAGTLMAMTVVDPETARERMLQSLLSDEDVATGIEWTLPADVPPDEVAELLDLGPLREALEQDREELGARVAGHVQASLDLITAALAGAGIELPASGVSAMPPLERERHVWVQAQDGTAWLDLDPSFGALQPGDTATAAAETLEALPDELRHIVDFTVIAETLSGGGLAQEPILEVAFYADELAYLGLVFGHARAEDLAGLEGIDLVGAGLSEGTRYTPLLLFGPQAIVGERSISIGGGGGSAFVDAFGGGGGEGLVEGETSAEWLEVTLFPPDGEPVVARRAIFDRVGTAMRESGAIDPYAVPAAEFVDIGDGDGAQYLPARGARAFSVTGATPNLKMLIQELGLDEVGPVSMGVGTFEAMRALLGAELVGSLGSLGFPDAPAVTSLVAEPTATGAIVGLDIWHRPFGSLGLADVMPTVPPAMLSGVVPHAVERALIEGDSASGPAAEPFPSPVSVGAVFEAAAAQGIATRLLAGSLPADAPYDPESRALLQRALDAGRLAIVPERPVDLGGQPRLGWWLVDPVSGAAADQMDDGGGQSQTGTRLIERLIVFSLLVVAGYALAKYGPELLCRMGLNAKSMNEANLRQLQGEESGSNSCGAQTDENTSSNRTIKPLGNKPTPEKDMVFGGPSAPTPIPRPALRPKRSTR